MKYSYPCKVFFKTSVVATESKNYLNFKKIKIISSFITAFCLLFLQTHNVPDILRLQETDFIF